MRKEKLPKFFQSILWWCKIEDLDARKDMRMIAVQTVNYGDLRHWRWIIQRYGKERIRRVLKEIPMSEFGAPSLQLAMTIFGINKMKYASRSAYIERQKALAKT